MGLVQVHSHYAQTVAGNHRFAAFPSERPEGQAGQQRDQL